ESELLFWLRGAYRNLGIGRQCMDAIREDLRDEVPKLGKPPRTVSVRFPGVARPGGGNQMQKDMWLRFFHRYDFRRRVEVGDRAADLVLVRQVPQAAANGGGELKLEQEATP